MNVHYDQDNGLGQTPYNANIDYRGFKCWMYPQMFLRLAKRIFIDPQDPSYLFLKAAIKRGKPIGSPFFEATWNESQPVWEIDSHEGRHRMQAIHDLWPNEMVEVHIFPRGGLRGKDITPQLAQSFMRGVFAEDSTYVEKPTAKIVAAGKTFTPQSMDQQQPVMETQLQKLQREIKEFEGKTGVRKNFEYFGMVKRNHLTGKNEWVR